MARSYVPLRDRADYTADLRAIGLSLSLAIIDVEPRAGAGTAVDGGCATCSFVSFLKGRDDLSRFRGLSQVLAALERLASPPEDLEQAARAATGVSIYSLRPQMGDGAARILHIDWGAEGNNARVRDGDAVVLQPDGRGPEPLLARLGQARRAGATRILIGYARHADAVDHWPAFLEHPDLAEGWVHVLAQARQLGVSEVGFAMAYPPCATLQWSHNRALESLRARLDLQFRRLDHEASLMCPENVSGYSLINDTREALAAVPVTASRFAIRTEDALFVY